MKAKQIIIYALVGIVAVLFLKSIFGAFNRNVIKSTKRIEETRKTDFFHGIEVEQAIEVELIKSDLNKIELEAGDKEIEHVMTEVKEGILHIHRANSFSSGFDEVKAKVYYTGDLDMIKASSAAQIKGKDTLYADFDIKASSSGEIKLLVNNGVAKLDASSAGEITLRGKTAYLNAEASSGAELKLEDLISTKCEIRASSGADVEVHPMDELNAKASSGADIKFRGNPGILEKDASSGGDIKKMD